MSDKKPSTAQRKVLEAVAAGKALERRQPLRLNKPRYWTLDNRKIASASPDACMKEGWVEAAHVAEGKSPFARWHTLYTLTPLGRAALKKD